MLQMGPMWGWTKEMEPLGLRVECEALWDLEQTLEEEHSDAIEPQFQ